MKSNTITYGILRAIGILAGILLLLYFLYAIRSVLTYIVIAAVISLIGRPIIRFLRRRLKFKNGLAVGVTMLIIFGVLFGVMAMFIPLIAEQGQNLSLLNLDSLKDDLSSLLKDSALLHQGIMTFVKDNNEYRATQSFNKIKDLLSRYFLGLLLQILVLFILYTSLHFYVHYLT